MNNLLNKSFGFWAAAAVLVFSPLSFSFAMNSDLPVGSPAASSSSVTSGTYWVPVAEQFSRLALFELPYVEVKKSSDEIELEYEIPKELTGARNKVKFKGDVKSDGPVTLSGSYGTMECPSSNDFSNCAVSYRDLTFDAEARTALLQSISQNDDELHGRQMVAARFQFGGEPHGFVRLNETPTRTAATAK